MVSCDCGRETDYVQTTLADEQIRFRLHWQRNSVDSDSIGRGTD